MKHDEAVKEFIDHELDDYSYFENREIDLEDEYQGCATYSLVIKPSDGKTFSVRLKASEGTKGSLLEVEISEGNWQQVEWYEPSVKYFWMALLWR